MSLGGGAYNNTNEGVLTEVSSTEVVHERSCLQKHWKGVVYMNIGGGCLQ